MFIFCGFSLLTLILHFVMGFDIKLVIFLVTDIATHHYTRCMIWLSVMDRCTSHRHHTNILSNKFFSCKVVHVFFAINRLFFTFSIILNAGLSKLIMTNHLKLINYHVVNLSINFNERSIFLPDGYTRIWKLFCQLSSYTLCPTTYLIINQLYFLYSWIDKCCFLG